VPDTMVAKPVVGTGYSSVNVNEKLRAQINCS